MSNIVELLLFNVVAVLFGALRDREKRREQEKLEAVMAMAGCVGHELNNPLAIALQAAELAETEIEPGSDSHQDIETVNNNLRRMSVLIRKITGLDRIELTHYAGNCHIVDLERSTGV